MSGEPPKGRQENLVTISGNVSRQSKWPQILGSTDIISILKYINKTHKIMTSEKTVSRNIQDIESPPIKAKFIMGKDINKLSPKDKTIKISELRESVLNMGNKLNSFTIKNRNTSHVNHQIYHLLLDPFTINNAYKNLSKNKGSFTNGYFTGNIQGYSREKTYKLISLLKKNEYFPDPVKRVWVPKPGKSTKRPLGIPSFYDRIVQEAMRGILEAIYEPMFREFYSRAEVVENFGFRPNLSCWNAMEHFTIYAQTCTYVIEGDIKGAYDNVDHNILLGIIEKRVKDKNFLKLLNRFLKAGIMNEGKYQHSLLAVPQGGILSPLLFNIYMFEFDKFIYELITRERTYIHNQNKTKEYQKALYNKKKILQQYRTVKERHKETKNKALLTQLKSLKKQLKAALRTLYETPSKDNRKLKSFVFTRYADDWILGIGGNKAYAEGLKQQIDSWMQENLKLSLSPEKTKISNIRNEFVPFLGYEMKINSPKKVKITNLTFKETDTNKSQKVKRRTTSNKFFIRPNATRLYNNVKNLGICKGADLKPIGKRAWATLDEFQIVQKYHSIFLGIVTHYTKCSTYHPLNRLDYIFKYSCAKTIATRKRLTLPQVLNKYGPYLRIEKPYLDNPEKIRVIEYMGFKRIKETYFTNITEKTLTPYFDPFKIRTFWRTTFKLYSQCCICGSDTSIEMHHINSLKNIKLGKNKTSFNLILKQLNRKQIPVCKPCHSSITSGTYDKKSVTDLFNQSLAAL